MLPLKDVLQDDRFMSQLKPGSLYGLLSRDSKLLTRNLVHTLLRRKEKILIAGAGGVLALNLLRN